MDYDDDDEAIIRDKAPRGKGVKAYPLFPPTPPLHFARLTREIGR